MASDPKILDSVIGPNEVHLYYSEDQHGNWLDCIRSRKEPIAPAEVGHRACSTCLIHHIAMKTGRRLHWDSAKERFLNDDDANRRLSRPQRISPGVENRLPDHPCCAAAASAMTSTAGQEFSGNTPPRCGTATIGVTHSAIASMANFRPAFTEKPCLIKTPESPPPRIDPPTLRHTRSPKTVLLPQLQPVASVQESRKVEPPDAIRQAFPSSNAHAFLLHSKAKERLLFVGGFDLNTITTYYSGKSFQITDSSQQSYGDTAVPNQVSQPAISGTSYVGGGNFPNYIVNNGNYTKMPNATANGNVGRNTVRGPGYFISMSVSRGIFQSIVSSPSF